MDKSKQSIMVSSGSGTNATKSSKSATFKESNIKPNVDSSNRLGSIVKTRKSLDSKKSLSASKSSKSRSIVRIADSVIKSKVSIKPNKGSLLKLDSKPSLSNMRPDLDDDAIPYRYKGERDLSYRRHGFGTIVYPNGDGYTGQWFRGGRSGKGDYTYSDGSFYSGEWDGGMRAGDGMMKYNDGSSYEGEWFNDQRHGWGKYEFENGDIYEGQFVHGKMQGWRGLYSFADPPHLYYLGPFKDNKIVWSDCAQIGNGKLYASPEGRAVAERRVYIDRNRPYSAEKALDDFINPPSEEEEPQYREEIVTDWSDL